MDDLRQTVGLFAFFVINEAYNELVIKHVELQELYDLTKERNERVAKELRSFSDDLERSLELMNEEAEEQELLIEDLEKQLVDAKSDIRDLKRQLAYEQTKSVYSV